MRVNKTKNLFSCHRLISLIGRKMKHCSVDNRGNGLLSDHKVSHFHPFIRPSAARLTKKTFTMSFKSRRQKWQSEN